MCKQKHEENGEICNENVVVYLAYGRNFAVLTKGTQCDISLNMRFVWNEDKNNVLKKQRNISFEQILATIEDNQIVDVIEHPNNVKYRGQIYIMVNYDEYIYVVPAVISESGEECFLKTIYPSRKYTQKYLIGNSNEQNK